jgi:hypothetical protein
LTVPAGVTLDVGRFQIAMDDPLLVGGIERIRDLPRQGERLCERHRATREPVGQRLAVHQLHDERADVGAVLDAIDRRDVGVIERGQHPRLALEARHPVGVGVKARGRTLTATSRPSRLSRA